jgi:hypothetical protein
MAWPRDCVGHTLAVEEVASVTGALVGRAGELATLTEALGEAGRGRGRLVLVRGEAGIGKTRLVDELAAGAAPVHVVLTGRAVPGGGAFRPVAEALADDVDGLLPPGDIHRVTNTGTGLAVSLHVYGADLSLVGSSIRRRYDDALVS